MFISSQTATMASIFIMLTELSMTVSRPFSTLPNLHVMALANSVAELNNWLINAFNGEWLRTADAVPKNFDIEPKEING